MKKRIIKAFILPILFVLAVIGFSAYMNQGDTDMTTDMDVATLQTISFMRDEVEMNPVVGHKNEMDIASVRDNILPYSNGTITGFLQAYESVIASAKYEIYTLNGTELLESDVLEIKDDRFTISAENLLENGKELLLKITLVQEEGIYVWGDTFNNFLENGSEEEKARGWAFWAANYRNHGRYWERKANITVFNKERECVLTQKVGLRTQGGASRVFRSWRIGCHKRTTGRKERNFS